MLFHRVFAQVNLDCISHNILSIRSYLNNNTKIMAVVKADAYGHGCLPVAKTCLFNGADYLGVAIVEEAIELRDNNIFEPILILGNTIKSRLPLIIKYDLEQTIFSFSMAKHLSDLASKFKKVVNIHIKIDTGMSRLGFLPTQKSLDEIIQISRLPFLHISGVYTHLACSDHIDPSFSFTQFNIFTDFVSLIEKNGISGFLKHISNSAGILNFPSFNLDMVRPGIIIYGLYPSHNIHSSLDLLPAMSIKTYISSIKHLPPNTSIGYSRTFFTKNHSIIATIPVGYADGYSRLLSNKASVIVAGKLAPVVGNICMDQFMIDISSISNVNVGDEVILVGSHLDLSISFDYLASLQSTINYELVSTIGKRVPRIYIKNGSPL